MYADSKNTPSSEPLTDLVTQPVIEDRRPDEGHALRGVIGCGTLLAELALLAATAIGWWTEPPGGSAPGPPQGQEGLGTFLFILVPLMLYPVVLLTRGLLVAFCSRQGQPLPWGARRAGLFTSALVLVAMCASGLGLWLRT